MFFSYYRAQYIDTPGLVIRLIEKSSAEDYQKAAKKSLDKLLAIETVNIMEAGSRTTISAKNVINFAHYSTICNQYMSPIKRSKCSKKYTYIKDAYEVLYETYISGAGIKINRANREQVDEKFIRISNYLIKELEQMKYEAKKNSLFYILKLSP